MIKLIIVFLFTMLTLAAGYMALSNATLKEFKLAFKVGALASFSLAILFFISLF
jgi:hypothetical protein